MEIQVKKSRKVKGVRQKLKLFRANEPLKSVIMWGINHSMDQLNHVNKRTMLLPDDFKSFLKVKVDNHFFNKDNMPSRFKFKEYCPLVFQDLRAKFGVDQQDYLDSFTRHQPVWDASQGRADSKFLCTYNRHFVVKTITSEDVEQMHHLLQSYHGHVVERSAATLLPQYLGMYRATVEDTEYYLLVKRPVFSPRLRIHRKYDLKGSTIDREASEKERSKELPTFKDVDFVNAEVKISIGESEKERVMEMLRQDVEFLERNHLMDYSLLVGIHDLREGNDDDDDDDSGGGRAAAGPADEEAGDDDMEAGNCSSGNEPEAPEATKTTTTTPTTTTTAAAAGGITPPDSPLADAGVVFEFAAFRGELDPAYEKFAIFGQDAQRIYFLSLIDILTRYGVRKRTAQTYKSMKHGYGNERQLSTVKPDVYSRRFLDFIEACVE